MSGPSIEEFDQNYEQYKEEKKDFSKITPLHYAAEKNLTEIGEILITKGEDIKAKDLILQNMIILFFINGI